MSNGEERRILRSVYLEVKRLWADLKLEQKKQRMAEMEEFRLDLHRRAADEARAIVREAFAEMREQMAAEEAKRAERWAEEVARLQSQLDEGYVSRRDLEMRHEQLWLTVMGGQ